MTPDTDASSAREKQTHDTRAAAYGIGRDESSSSRLAGCNLLARLLEPVADEIGFRRYAPGVSRKHPGHVLLAQVRDQELAAQVPSAVQARPQLQARQGASRR